MSDHPWRGTSVVNRKKLSARVLVVLLNLSSNLIRRGVRPVRTLSALLLERYSPILEYNLVSGPENNQTFPCDPLVAVPGSHCKLAIPESDPSLLPLRPAFVISAQTRVVLGDLVSPGSETDFALAIRLFLR